MKKISDKTKIIILTITCILLILAIGFTIVMMLNSNKDNVNDSKNTSEITVNNNRLYGIVEEAGENYIKVKSTDSDATYLIKVSDSIYETGDLITIYYKKQEDIIEPIEIDIVAKNEIISEYSKTTNIEDTTKKITTTSIATTTNNIPNNNYTNNATSEDDLINYIKEENEKISVKEKAKDYFITLIDFIFYGGTIKGKTFNELTTQGKAKVIYYTLLADQKIESIFPNYKDSLQTKYNDIKAKLILKYIDITTTICTEEPTGTLCSNLKEDLSFLKTSLKITWDVIKPGLNYIKELGLSGISKLKDWYETFRTS